MTRYRKQYGQLDCVCVEAAGTRPKLAVVLCHGVNAPGDDLVALGEEALELAPKLAGHVRFCFPAGVMDSAQFGMPGGRAWWEIDWALFAQMMNSGDYSAMYQSHPRGLDAARAALQSCIDALMAETGLDESRVVPGGFSQGAMLATDTVLRAPKSFGALIAFSGTVICEGEWKALAPARRGLRVLQSHGRQDPVLPFAGAQRLRDLLVGAGCQVEFVPFAGQHGISLEALQRLAVMLQELLKPL